jgi:hypothetical protein
MRKLTQARLREALDYNPKTGIFTWKPGTHYAGRQAGGASDEYVRIRIKGKLYRAHRLAFLWMEGWMPEQVDHRDLDKTNNRWDNLRAANNSQNQHNKRITTNNSSGRKGVSWFKQGGKWRADIRIDGVLRYLGLHDSMEDAAAAYKAAAEHYFGEFARSD